MFKNKKIFTILFVIIFSFTIHTTFIFPLDPAKILNKCINNILTTKNGLPQNSIYDIVQDNTGYIWIGTGQGITRFDGYHFEVFDKINTREIKNNSITTLMISNNGSLWFGTFGGGVVVYENNVFRSYTTKNGLPNDFIWTITQDRNKNIWIGTNGGGLIHFEHNKIKTFTNEDGLSDNTIFTICEDKQGKLWIGTENGLNCKEGSKFTVYKTGDGIADNTITSIFKDSKNILWIGTLNGLTSLKEQKFKTYTTKNGLLSNLIHSIYEDKDQNLWVATDRGLNRIYNNKIDRFTTKDGLSDNCVMTLFEDRENNLWIGTSGGGLNILHNGKFLSYTTEEGLSSNFIKPLYEDNKGNLWVGTNGGGLNKIRDGIIKSYTTDHGLISNFINSIYGDSKGNLWIGTNRGINLYKNGKFITLESNNKTIKKSVISLYEDHSGNIWIGTYGGGLHLYKNGVIRTFDKNRGLSNNFVLSITEDKNGSLWIGTNRGLNRLKNNRFKTYAQNEGLSNDTIYDIYIDRSGTLWIGTNGGGLNRFKNEKFTSYTTEHGLFNNVIYRIIPDNRGNIWMSSNNGIFMISKKELNQFAEGKISYLNCKHFHESDGMKSSVCSGGFQPAGWKTKNGKLNFPTIKGVATINPEKITFNKKEPPVIINKVTIDGISKEFNKNLTLSARTKKIGIYFTAISFTAPVKIRFSYRLFGYKKKWTETNSRDKIDYSNLPSGNYKFKIIACNNDRVWNYRGTSFSFTIKPKIFQTFWFYLIVAASLSLFFFWIYHLSESRLKKRAEERRKYKKSTLTPGRSNLYKQKLLELMEQEKLYIDEEITLEKLAERLTISKKHLSQIINEQLNQNFKNFINKYRVEEAKEKLLDPKEIDFVLLKIAFDVGFNSKSVFNSAFKKFTKMSPSEYREKYYKE